MVRVNHLDLTCHHLRLAFLRCVTTFVTSHIPQPSPPPFVMSRQKLLFCLSLNVKYPLEIFWGEKLQFLTLNTIYLRYISIEKIWLYQSQRPIWYSTSHTFFCNIKSMTMLTTPVTSWHWHKPWQLCQTASNHIIWGLNKHTQSMSGYASD